MKNQKENIEDKTNSEVDSKTEEQATNVKEETAEAKATAEKADDLDGIQIELSREELIEEVKEKMKK